jgi:hypothetical protein
VPRRADALAETPWAGETGPEERSEQLGVLLAPHFDRWWRSLGASDPFVVVVEGTDGGGALRGVLAAVPACASALRVVLVEPDDLARGRLAAANATAFHLEPAEQALGPLAPGESADDEAVVVPGRGPLVTALAAAPEVPGPSVALALGVLSTLPADVFEWRAGQWQEVRVAAGAGDELREVLVPAPPGNLPTMGVPDGWRVPRTQAAAEWLADTQARCAATQGAEGLVVVVDHLVTSTVDLAGPTPRPGVALDQIDPGATGRPRGDEALSPLVVVEWGASCAEDAPRKSL